MEAHIKSRNGITPSVSTITLPCDPIALVQRLDILMASKAVRNTGVRNELVSACDELIDKHTQNYNVAIIQC